MRVAPKAAAAVAEQSWRMAVSLLEDNSTNVAQSAKKLFLVQSAFEEAHERLSDGL